jgi:hypothetical protein
MAAPGLQEPAKKALATLDREWDGLTAHRDYPMVSLDNDLASYCTSCGGWRVRGLRDAQAVVVLVVSVLLGV